MLIKKRVVPKWGGIGSQFWFTTNYRLGRVFSSRARPFTATGKILLENKVNIILETAVT